MKSAITRLQGLVKDTRFRNRADLFSLWSAFCYLAGRIGQVDFARTESQLRELAQNVDAVPELEYEQYADQEAVAYSQAVRAGQQETQPAAPTETFC